MCAQWIPPRNAYEEAKKEGKNNPNLQWNGETERHHSWPAKDFNTREKLKEFLPECVYEHISTNRRLFADIDTVIGLRAGVGFHTLLQSNVADGKCHALFLVTKEMPEINYHFFQITAKVECERFLVWQQKKIEICGLHKVSSFTLKNREVPVSESHSASASQKEVLDFLMQQGTKKLV